MKTLSNYKSLVKNILSTNNNGKFGIDRLEYHVIIENGSFGLLVTDGYKYLGATKLTNSISEVKAFLRQGK